MSKSTKPTSPDTVAAIDPAADTATAQPDPNQPTSNPPGGGRWTWSAAEQTWQAVPDPEPDLAA